MHLALILIVVPVSKSVNESTDSKSGMSDGLLAKAFGVEI